MSTSYRRPALAALGALSVAAGLAACGSSSANSSSGSTSSAQVANAAAAGGGSAACPNGKVRLGVEPYEAPAKLTPAYQVLAAALQKGLGCPVEVQIVQDYPAEVLAMRNGKLELAEFGPLGYVFGDQQAKAEAVASFATADGKLSTYTAGIWVPKGSSVQSLTDLKGHTLALSSAGSTSGDALPRYAMLKAGLSPSDVKITYAGGHPQSLLALTKGKVDAGEVNSQEQATATQAGQFDASKYREIWRSDPIPNDPITVYGGLPQAFKDKVKQVLTSLSPQDIAAVGKYLDVTPPGPMVAVTKADYQQLFDLASALHLTIKDA